MQNFRQKYYQENYHQANRFQVNKFQANSFKANFTVHRNKFVINWIQMAKGRIEPRLILRFLQWATRQTEVSFMGMGIQKWRKNLWQTDNEFTFICVEFELLGRHLGRDVQQAVSQIYGAQGRNMAWRYIHTEPLAHRWLDTFEHVGKTGAQELCRRPLFQ